VQRRTGLEDDSRGGISGSVVGHMWFLTAGTQRLAVSLCAREFVTMSQPELKSNKVA
jgi:hypothetical protein